jgi:hypothetical protein
MKPIAYYILLFLVLLSLLLNGLILAGLLLARQTVIQGLDAGIQMVSDLKDETFETTVHVRQAIPIKASFPFRRTLTVPIDLVLPVSQKIAFRETLLIPVNTVLGRYDLQVPISLTIPVSLTVPIKTRIPFTISEMRQKKGRCTQAPQNQSQPRLIPKQGPYASCLLEHGITPHNLHGSVLLQRSMYHGFCNVRYLLHRPTTQRALFRLDKRKIPAVLTTVARGFITSSDQQQPGPMLLQRLQRIR